MIILNPSKSPLVIVLLSNFLKLIFTNPLFIDCLLKIITYCPSDRLKVLVKDKVELNKDEVKNFSLDELKQILDYRNL